MSNTSEAPKKNKPNAFQNIHCSVCDKITLHYKAEGGESGCCECTRKLVTEGQTISGYKYAEIPIGMHRPPVDNDSVSSPIDMSLWKRSAEKRVTKSRQIEAPDLADLFADEIAASATKTADKKTTPPMLCSFCGSPVDVVNSHSEKVTKIQVLTDIEFTEDGTPIEKRKVLSTSVVKVACPNCCLKVKKPTATRIV